MKIIRQSFLFILMMTLFTVPIYLYAEDGISTTEVVEDTLNATSNCMHYQVVGLCFWQKTPFTYPSATLKLDQYLPDAVVSVFNKPTDNPWDFANKVVDPITYPAGKAIFKQFDHDNLGYGDEHEESGLDLDDHFHEIDIIGNPILTLYKHSHIMLPSAANPFDIYYSSLLDAYAWRFPLLERFAPGALLPGVHDVGKILINKWGAVFPRNGFIDQPDDVKAAAVIAQRASDIITKNLEPHLYQNLSNTCGREQCNADPVKENDKHTQFQMIYPIKETSCQVFGSSRDYETAAQAKGNNRYVWILWRHYHGCVPGKGKFIGSISF